MRNILLSGSVQSFGWVKVLQKSPMHRRKSSTCIGWIISKCIKDDYTDKSQTYPNLSVICVYEFYTFQRDPQLWVVTCLVKILVTQIWTCLWFLWGLFLFFTLGSLPVHVILVNRRHECLGSEIPWLVFVKLEKQKDECPKHQNAFPRNGSVEWWSRYSGTDTKVMHLHVGLPVCS